MTLADSTQGICSSCAFCCAHHFHDLRLGHVFDAGHVNVVARFHTEAPGALAVLVQTGGDDGDRTQDRGRGRGPEQAVCGLFRKRTAAGGDTLLPAQEGRFLVYIQVDQARVVELLASRFKVRMLGAGWVQLLLQDGAARLPRHRFRSVVVSNR
jgi:hypothetical protein